VAVNPVSVEWTSRITAVIAAVTVLALAGIVGVGFGIVAPGLEALHPPIPPTIGVQAFGLTFMMIFFAFTGWELAANLSADFHNPSRDFPLAMGLSFLVAAVLYIALAVIAGAIDLGNRPEAPFVALFDHSFGPAGGRFVALAAIILVVANLAAAVWAVSRMVWSAAGDRLLPAGLRVTRDSTPYRAVIATVGALIAVVCLSALGAVDLATMLAMAGQNFLLIYAVSAAALLVCGRRLAEQALAIFCVSEVVLLMALRGGEGIAYPVLLFAMALFAMKRCHGPTVSKAAD